MKFEVLGTLAVIGPDGPITPGSPTQRAILSALLASRDLGVSTDTLIDLIWGTDPPAGAAGSLQSHVSRLRKAIGGVRIVGTDGGYRLQVDPEAIDACRFETILETARGEPDPGARLKALDTALSLWRGRPFDDLADHDTLRIESIRLSELALRATEDRAATLLELGRGEQAVPILQSHVAANPLRERPVSLLMKALYRTGRHPESVRVYNSFVTELAEIGLEPGPGISALEMEILGHASGSTRDPTGNLPRALDRFVGRVSELEHLTSLLGSGRLVTITGPGGVGKTRLATEYAAADLDKYPDGAWICDLGALRDDPSVPHAIAHALGVGVLGDSPMEALINYLHNRDALVIVDNCEHVRNAATDAIAHLFHECPRLAILATSRERLGLAGEQTLPLRPLSNTGERDAAVELFLDRARSVRPDYTGVKELETIRNICHRLDGIPLAIEMAAARIRTFTAAEIEDRLDKRYSLLRNPYRTPAGRHQTLRQVFEWSYELLEDPERRLLESLSVLAGDFDLEACEAIAPPSSDGIPSVDLLENLVDRSLVEVDHDPTGTRYRILETLRAFAAEQLAAGDRARATGHTHAEHFVALAERAGRGMQGPDESHWLQVIDVELDNLRASFQWAIANNEPDLALRMVAALYPVGYNRAASEFLEWGELAASQYPTPHPLLPAAYAAAGALAIARGDLAAAKQIVARATADPELAAATRGLGLLADIALIEGDTDTAVEMTFRNHRRAVEIGDSFAVCDALVNRALGYAYSGQISQAVAVCEELNDIVAELENPTQLAWADFVTGEVLIDVDPERAASCLQAAIMTANRVDARFVQAVAGLSLASLHARHNDHSAALASFENNIKLWQTLGDTAHLMVAIRNMLTSLPQPDSARDTAILLGGVTAAQISAPYGAESERLANVRNALQATLDDEFDAAVAAGRRMRPAEVIDYALASIARSGFTVDRPPH
jgi:predicted ATPase/DNA-binding SARP family transcriptional activator